MHQPGFAMTVCLDLYDTVLEKGGGSRLIQSEWLFLLPNHIPSLYGEEYAGSYKHIRVSTISSVLWTGSQSIK